MNFSVKYLYQRKTDGACLYHRRTPEDLKEFYYGGKLWIRQSLKTHILTEAIPRCEQLTKELEALWAVLRSDSQRINASFRAA